MMTTETSPYIYNFPFPKLRTNQESVLRQIESAFNSGYRYIILEAPTGTGKSPIAIATGLSNKSSYILTSTKNLQSQYHHDFPYVLKATGRQNWECPILREKGGYYTTADHAPCLGDREYKCPLKTKLKDYYLKRAGTKEELVIFDEGSHERGLLNYDGNICSYFHQRNKALAASHSVINYSMFLSLLGLFPTRPLLVLDEAHELPSEVLKFQSFSIKTKYQKYIPDFELPNLGYDDVRGWTEFLIGLKETILKKIKVSRDTASDIAEAERKILAISLDPQPNQLAIQKLEEKLKSLNLSIDVRLKDLPVEIREDLQKLKLVISTISMEPLNWIVSDIRYDALDRTVAKVELKPLNVSRKCLKVLEKGEKVLMMSATILDSESFCREVGLDPHDVKVIKVGSTFPIKNRVIYPWNIAYLNKNTIGQEEVKRAIVRAVDKIMTHHKDHKGIIHTTSYDQLNNIIFNISEENRRRLIKTDPDLDRDDVLRSSIVLKYLWLR